MRASEAAGRVRIVGFGRLIWIAAYRAPMVCVDPSGLDAIGDTFAMTRALAPLLSAR